MRSRLSLKSLARPALNLFLASALTLFFISGCSSSTRPTFIRENIEDSVRNICKQEYGIDTVVRLEGRTLWVYIPVEDMLIKADKPEKYVERFEVAENLVQFRGKLLEVDYGVKLIPEKEKTQEYQYNKPVLEKLSNVWKVLRRVIFSLDRSKQNEPHFFCLVLSDIKTGFEIREVFYHLDLKKVSYSYISWGEYQHRAISETDFSPRIIGDKSGRHVIFRDIGLEEFLAMQIEHRIRLKFQKPEVDRNADIDKEVSKIVSHTLRTYGLKDFESVELINIFTGGKSVLNQRAVLERPDD